MKKRFTVLLLSLLLLSFNSFAQIRLPNDHVIEGWQKSDKPLFFQKENLFDYINGGAEIFHEFGFKDLLVQSYKNGEEEIILELYQMESPESALGIYLTRKGKEKPIDGIKARSTGNRYQFTIVQGVYFIQVNNFTGNEKQLPVMVQLIQPILEQLPANTQISLLKQLPEENLVHGSERLIRGIYSLQPIYTLGPGDMLHLNGKIFGVVGDYKNNNHHSTLILISYPSEKMTVIVLDGLKKNLDPYLTKVEEWDDGLIFKDFQNMYGFVKKTKNRLVIKVKLKEKPERN